MTRAVSNPTLCLRLASELRDAAKAMLVPQTTGQETVSHADLAAIERLKHWCDRVLPIARHRTDRFMLFFVSTFIHDMFFNLVGDFRYDESTEEMRQAFFKTLAKRLNDLGESITATDPVSQGVACEKLIDSYLAAIDAINQGGENTEVRDDISRQ